MSSEITKEAQSDALFGYERRSPGLSVIVLADLNPENKTRLRRELYQRLDQAKFYLDEVLLDGQQTLVEAYLPRLGPMPSQEEVAETSFGDPRTEGFKRVLQRALVRFDRRYYIGPRAIEVLKPTHYVYSGILNFGLRMKEDEAFSLVSQIDLDTISGLTWLARRRILLAKEADIATIHLNEAPYLESLKISRILGSEPKISRLRTIEDINKAGNFPAIIASISGALPMFYEFQMGMQNYYPTWPGWRDIENVFAVARQFLYLRKELHKTL